MTPGEALEFVVNLEGAPTYAQVARNINMSSPQLKKLRDNPNWEMKTTVRIAAALPRRYRSLVFSGVEEEAENYNASELSTA